MQKTHEFLLTYYFYSYPLGKASLVGRTDIVNLDIADGSPAENAGEAD